LVARLARASALRERIWQLRAGGTRIGTCVPVLCEVEAGIQQVRHPDEYRRNLTRLPRQVRVWPIDYSTARIYGEIHRDLRQRGRVLSQVDIMLAALARQMQLTLVSSDQDFAALPDLPRENWLPPVGGTT
jgi:tRNA(fMet)-specific endonuclease VapC